MIKRIVLCLVLTLFWLSPAFAKNPVLIVHGLNGDSQSFKDGCLVTTLKNAGIDVFTLADLFGDFPNRGQGLIQEDVKNLKKAIDEVKRRTGAEKVDIVAHSRGGIVAELYTMMFGEQYQSTMKYTYIDTTGKPKKKTITDIPRYGNDVNQIIMMGTPQMGSFWADFGHENPDRAKFFRRFVSNTPDPESVAVEQLQKEGSNFMEYFWNNGLNPDVTYTNLAEDRFSIIGGYGDGVVSFESAKGVSLHQELKTAKEVGNFAPEWVDHNNLYRNTFVKKQLLQDLFAKNPITTQISISRESPVREGAITIYVTTSEPLQIPPKLFVQGNGLFGMLPPQQVSLSGSGKNFSGTLLIPKDTDGQAKLYFDDKTQVVSEIS